MALAKVHGTEFSGVFHLTQKVVQLYIMKTLSKLSENFLQDQGVASFKSVNNFVA